MKNYLIRNNREVQILVNTDAPNDGREGLITSITGLDAAEIRDYGFIYGVGDTFDEGDLIDYARAHNFSINSFNQDNLVNPIFDMDDEFRFTITTASASTVFTLPATSDNNNFTIDWGDSNTEVITAASPTHTYATADTYQISITGLMPLFSFNDGGDAALVVSLDNMGDTGLENMIGFMYGCSNLASANLNDFGAPFSVQDAFRNCTSLTTFTVSRFNTTRVHDFSSFIRGSNTLTGFDCSEWNMSNVTSVAAIFSQCTALTDIPVRNWDLGNCTDFTQMIDRCTSLVSLDVEFWDVSSADTFNFFAFGCSALTDFNVSRWRMPRARILNFMFRNCTALTNIDATNWDTSNVRAAQGVITGSTNLVSFGCANWDVSNCDDLWVFAEDCSALLYLPVGNWRFPSGTRVARFIDNCDAIVFLDVRDWNVENIDNFGGFARNSANLTTVDTSQWQTAAGTEMAQIFNNCPSLTSTMNPNAFWLNTGITSFSDAFTDSSAIANFADIPNNWKGVGSSPSPPPVDPVLPLPPDS